MSKKTTASDEANKGEKCESEQDARIALLGHFSSKSTNEAIILLTEAFVFFTFVGLLPTNSYKDYLMIVASGFFVCFASYAFGRLIYWGEQATAILVVKMTNESETKNHLDNEANKLGLQKPKKPDKNIVFTLNLSPTYLNRLSFACVSYFVARRKSGKSLLIKVYYILHSRKWVLLVLAVTAVALIIRYYY